MLKNVCILTLTITISLYAMDIPSNEMNETIRYEKTHPSVRTLTKKKSFIQKAHHKKKHLKEKLENKPECFWMWTPEEGAFHYLYQAKNRKDLDTIINLCNPSLRMGKYSILSSIMLSPHMSFQEKKEIIARLLSQNYVPTNADKKLNLLETWDRCAEKKIIEKICLFMWHNQNNAFQELAKKMILSITHTAFNLESLL
jgi:hypothetical protein